MASTCQEKLARIAALASRAEGVSNVEVQADLGCCVQTAAKLMWRAAGGFGLVRAKTPNGRLRMFASDQAARAWRASQAEGDLPRAAGNFNARQPVGNDRPPTAAELFARAEPETTPDTVHIVHSVRTEGHRISRMADAGPGVPGWTTGPAIRAGAMDFKRYQHHGPLATLTGKGGL